MTRAERLDNGKEARVYPEDTLADVIAALMDIDVDGRPVDLGIKGKQGYKKRLPGELNRLASKFHGFNIEVATSKDTIITIRMHSA